MRKPMYTMKPDAARALLASARTVHVATTTPEGRPVLRTLNSVVVGDWLYFHGAPVGEKTHSLGRPCVVAWDETVASIPSYFVDRERACPATTYYRSVQVHGVLVEVTDRGEKGRAMAAMMEHLQPEGGCVPIEADHPLYRKALDGILVVKVSLAELTGKVKLGQNRPPQALAGVLAGLWRRGATGDLRAIDLVRAHNPPIEPPEALRAPDGLRFVCAPEARHADGAAALLDGVYWNTGYSRARIAAAHPGSCAWLVLVNDDEEVVATARAISDRSKRGWLYDVCVSEAHRGRGLGKLLVAAMLDHPSLRGCATVMLGTRDAQSLYAQFGFVPRGELPSPGYTTTEMVLRRPLAQGVTARAEGSVPRHLPSASRGTSTPESGESPSHSR